MGARDWVGLRMDDNPTGINRETLIVGGMFKPNDEVKISYQPFAGTRLPDSEPDVWLLLFGLLDLARRIDACRDLRAGLALSRYAWLEQVDDPHATPDNRLMAAFKADLQSDESTMVNRRLLEGEWANGGYQTVRMLDTALRVVTGLQL